MTLDDKPKVDKYTRQLIRDAVRAVLTAAGFSEKEHNHHLQAALQITHTPAYRKLTLEAGWTDADLAAIANYLNIDVQKIFEICAGFWVGPDVEQATIQIGGTKFTCYVQTDGPATDTKFSDLVLQIGDGDATVVPYAEASKNVCLCINKISIKPNLNRLSSVALLEDDLEVLELAGELLSQRQMKPHLFQSIDALRDALRSRQFDIIVMDWWIRGRDVGELIPEIRNSDINRKSIIAIVTGRIRDSNQPDPNEHEFERLISEYGVKIYAKPVRWQFLAAEWALDLQA